MYPEAGYTEWEAVLTGTLEGEERSRTGESRPGGGTLSRQALKMRNPLEGLLIPVGVSVAWAQSTSSIRKR